MKTLNLLAIATIMIALGIVSLTLFEEANADTVCKSQGTTDKNPDANGCGLALAEDEDDDEEDDDDDGDDDNGDGLD